MVAPSKRPRVFLVSHFHWDREWYRTMQSFRARLVDAVDQVLELADGNDGFRFVLDGQAVVLEDYLVVRPDRLEALAGHVRAGRLGIGPWYVQPDSLLPSGESLIRNLLAGRRVAEQFGPVSSVAYVPDAFGHPAQLPQLFVGFGLDGFVYWRGNGSELDDLGPRWRWRAPDGSSVRALHLTEGYFNAARPPADIEAAVTGLAVIIDRLRSAGEEPVLLMNGFDHTRPDAHVESIVDHLEAAVGAPVERTLLDDPVAACPTQLPEYCGELVGARTANLLPGVWSARMPLKIRNRRCESLLQHWAEPWAALARVFGLADEGAALRAAWRSLLRNQAHDSICGCSIDAVHERMAARYDDAEGLASETIDRVLERLAGRNVDRDVPGLDVLDVAVFNPSPRTRTDLVRVALDAHPALAIRLGAPDLHPLVTAGLSELGFEVDGEPVRTVASDDPSRVRWLPGQRAFDLEFVARDVPAFGYRRFRVEATEPVADKIDSGPEIEAGDVRIEVEPAGTVAFRVGRRHWTGLFGIEDVGDRGDSYDFDPVGDAVVPEPVEVRVQRSRHRCGVQRLRVERRFLLPAELHAMREARSAETAEVSVRVDLVVGPGVPGARAEVRVDNRVRDHRLRLAFPTGGAVGDFAAATTFDVIRRRTAAPDDTRWVHPAPATFCHQGFVAANGLTVVAPALPEAEVTPGGVVLLTLVRSVGWLARYDLRTRALPAGPAMEAPGAQTQGLVTCELALLADAGPVSAAEFVAPLRGVIAGPDPVLAPDRPLFELDDDEVGLTALKPAEHGSGVIVRLANPTDRTRSPVVTTGFPVARAETVRLDETPTGGDIPAGSRGLRVEIPPHALRTVLLTPGESAD
jgi:mannosylglycerate hydrolase